MVKNILGILIVAGTLASCVSNKKLRAEQDKYAKLNTFYIQVQDDLRKCREEEAEASRRRGLLET